MTVEAGTVSVETVVIGGGQAGLAMSHHLSQLGLEHLVLERGRVAERWQSERWNSLTFQFPNRMLRLPGYAYDGPEPDAFMGRDGIAQLIVDYGRRLTGPVRCGLEVRRLRTTERGRFLLDVGASRYEAANVVVATGPYQLPVLPECSARMPLSVYQITANRYRRPADLPPGNVLVVGSGGSGCQIVEDLLEGGRKVYYSVRRHRRVPRSYRGRDFGWRIEANGSTELTLDRMPPAMRTSKAPMLTGVRGGHTIDLRQLADQGVTLLGGLADAVDGRAHFAADLNANVASGDLSFVQFNRQIDEFVLRSGLTLPAEDRFDPYLSDAPVALRELETIDLHASNITTVIWATGYRFDFGWIDCPVFDAQGVPRHRRGVTSVPGLHFLGLPRLHKLKSAFLWGVGEDAGFLAGHIAGRESLSGS